jgi:branched-subunit amino acid aminotransferase/4-amino-4-deoxychorismate lyase
VFSAAARSVRYGDGVFVTLRIADGVLLDAARQLDRLREAAAELGLLPPDVFEDPEDGPLVLAAVLERLGAGPATEGVARIQWSAGEGARGFGRPDVVADAIVDLGPAPAPREPVLVALDEVEAPLPVLPHLKTCSALAAVVCQRVARELGADDGIRTIDGFALETSSANLFWLRDSVLYTPAASLPLYAGSVRQRVIECARDGGLPVEEGAFAVDSLHAADSVFLANAVRGVESVRGLDGEACPAPGPIVGALAAAVEARRVADGFALEAI